ncbi:adenylate/guanylate cyclase domain-containing protein [Spirulina sp. 06S082]|uniref:adenylate/guanylate cyclase domain-containing protein n=1 Tax=Spirulina sp. 06S082 TaxID=3110248 RepID=UPI002B21D06D|nr:adenylate/guanylate cyclase domain-containing protein [Spirulina sp. 06S082]MEA5470032.1 adenylate/guanylate cyclase domain-containing protein [Spirulina sp. 06S082]
MYLRQKTLIAIGSLLTGLIAVLSISLSLVFLSSFSQLEKQDTRQNVQRAIAVFQKELSLLNILAEDWSHWDNTYNFVNTRDPSFLSTDLRPPTIEKLDFNFVSILDLQGKLVFATEFYDGEINRNVTIPPILTQQLSPNRLRLSSEGSDSSIKGFFVLNKQIAILAAHSILNSEKNKPIRGTLAFGRYIDDERMQEIAKQVQLSLKIYPLEDRPLPENLQSLRDRLEKQENLNPNETAILTQTLNAEEISGYTIFRDLYDRPIFLLQVTTPRDIYHQGQKSLYYLIFSLFIVGIIFSIGMIVLLERMILLRLSHVSKTVRKIGKTRDLSRRISIPGKDELNSLANTINWMLSSLEISEQELEKKQKRLEEEQEKAEQLLLNILPHAIAQTLKSDQSAIAEHFDEVTILFADIVGFTALSAQLSPIELVKLLNEIFSQFDKLVDEFALEKIKTIGDAYMIASGLPLPRSDHAEAMADMALAMQNAVEKFQQKYEQSLQIRIGINTGVVVAGVIGKKKFIYDLWGDAVNIASRMESSGEPSAIQVTEATYARLKDTFDLEKRGTIQIKGKGEMVTYWLRGRKKIS